MEPSVGTPLLLHDPRTVGPWTIHSRLGSGGMGVVYYATHEGQPAAIKVIRPGLLDAPATRDRFRREVGIMRRVRDVHICHYVDADLDAEPAWLALEYLSGPLLRDRVTDEGPLPEPDWWELAEGLAQALTVLEVHRVTHRDLKPGNVILNERGPVLIDFGIAHPEDATALTATGLVTGSPAWLSPEQANLAPVGPAADVFTLGSVLAFAATGRPPFGEGASIAVLTAIATRDPDLEGIDRHRELLLRAMLAKDPAERPAARVVLDVVRDRRSGAADEPAAPGAGGGGGGGARGASAAGGAAAAGLAGASQEALHQQGPPALGSPGQNRASGGRPSHAAAEGAGETRQLPAATPPVAGGAAPGAAPGPVGASPGGGASSPSQPPGAAPPPKRRASRVWLLVAVLAVVVAALVGILISRGTFSGGMPGSDTSQEGAAEPGASAADAPPAPASDQLRSGDWSLESYRFVNLGAQLEVTGTVRNTGAEDASASLVVWVYQAGQALGSVSTEVSDVPADDTVPVVMTGDAAWRGGDKLVLLEAE